ncbi:uncharacterized protein LOC135217855 [Macrobrachium nipponense]|uniref:uncharacterized protein LOC135217855 n=1 Tax=Macrobrachium nipponense TaxID=159736 RepID=UPI0030C7CD5D
MDIGRLHSVTLLVLRLATIWSTLPPPTSAPPPPTLHLPKPTAHAIVGPQPTSNLFATTYYDSLNENLNFRIESNHRDGALGEAANESKQPRERRPEVTLGAEFQGDDATQSRRRRSEDATQNKTTHDGAKILGNGESVLVPIAVADDDDDATDSSEGPPSEENAAVPDYGEGEDIAINITNYEILYDSSVFNNSFAIVNNSSRNSTDVFIATTGVYEYQMLKVAVLCTVLSIILLSTCKMLLQVFAKYAGKDKPNEI